MEDPRDPIPPERIARYLARTVATEDGGCLIWQGWINKRGYPEVVVNYRKTILHRLVYEAVVGPIPAGVDLHHRCGRRSCISADHVEPVTHDDHARLHSSHLAAFNEERRAATVCSRGHDLSGENVYIAPDGRRRCRSCRRDARRRHDRNRTPRRRRDHVRA